MNGILMTLVMILLMMVLILTIVILAFVLWWLIPFMRINLLVLLDRNKVYSEDGKESEAVEHTPEQATFERQPFDDKDVEAQYNKLKKNGFTSDSEEAVLIYGEECNRVAENEDGLEFLHEFDSVPEKITSKPKTTFESMVIGVVNAKALHNLGNKTRFSVNPQGNLTIYDKKKETYLVRPTEDCINEKDYQYSALNKCFRLSQEFKIGCLYKIMELKKPCIMRKKEDFFEVVEMGELQIEKMED